LRGSRHAPHPGVYFVTESDVYLHGDACLSKQTPESDAHTFIVGVFFDGLRCDRVRVKDKTIAFVDRDNVTKYRCQAISGVIDVS
jgi:hypothetical protein